MLQPLMNRLTLSYFNPRTHNLDLIYSHLCPNCERTVERGVWIGLIFHQILTRFTVKCGDSKRSGDRAITFALVQ